MTYKEHIDKITPDNLRSRILRLIDEEQSHKVTVCMDCDKDRQLHKLYEKEDIRVDSGLCRMHFVKALLGMGLSQADVEKELTEFYE